LKLGFGGLARRLFGDGSCGSCSFDAGSEAALVARGGVLVEDAFLHALVELRDGGLVDVGELLGVAAGDGLAQDAEVSANAAAAGAIDSGLAFGLAGSFERGNVVCHDACRCLF